MTDEIQLGDVDERLQTRLTRQVLADLFAAAADSTDPDDVDTIGVIASKAFGEALARDAHELAETRPEDAD